ncbi:hypothetical protein [Salinibacter grassmerensis]|uniref:hypothetical protein n=1 Tax=Salinibacter grassmerensis TaxID=3040353 RepID=UPI0021E9513D|nr:hypothetical protein [Salinibacter grassmerensis]
MGQVSIPILMPEADETLELEVTVGGRTLLMEYRIETVTWGPEVTPGERAEQIRAFLDNYNSDWSLVQIGVPEGRAVPITCHRRRKSTEAPNAGD